MTYSELQDQIVTAQQEKAFNEYYVIPVTSGSGITTTATKIIILMINTNCFTIADRVSLSAIDKTIIFNAVKRQ